MNKKKKLIITLAVIVVLVGVIVLISLLPEDNYADKYADTDLDTDVIGIEREGTYAQYVESHAGVAKPSNSVEVDVSAFTSEGDVESNVNYEGVKAVEGKDGSTLTWTVNVPQEGFYNIEVDYFIPKSRGINAQRQIMINGEIPFEDATNVSFTRVWKDDGEPIEDNQGNIIRPSQIEEYMWQTRLLSDDRGYINEPYKFFFTDMMITNFHLPKSTLLMLVSALYNKDAMLNAYKIAVEEKYRFFSFGDAMFIKN